MSDEQTGTVGDEQTAVLATVNTRIRELLPAIPKVELHLHLEAALTLTTLYEHLHFSLQECQHRRRVH
ncbi:MAG: hypothetical protein AB2L14_08870 [Candidatus Xenobiia bacterium LiM19]